MEPRKVQKVGYSTLSISLPMNWAKRTGVHKGDLVFISEEKDGALKLTAKPGGSEDSSVYVVSVDECENTKILARVIVGNYVLGRNMIKVESSRRLMREQIESIREVTQRLLGIGIIEEGDRHLLLQCSIDPKNFPLSTVMRRLYVITSIMFKEAVDSLVDADIELAKDAITREHEADTIYWLLARLLSSAQQTGHVAEEIGVTDPMEIVQSSIIAWFLEMIGDRVHNIASDIIDMQQLRKRGNDELIERLSQIGLITFTIFDKAVNSIFDGNVKVASDAVDLRETVEKEERNLMKDFQGKSDPEVATIASSIAWEFKAIAEQGSAIAEIAIDNVLRGDNEICRVVPKSADER